MLVTGYSGQTISWIAQNADGWLYYPRNINFLKESMSQWKAALKNEHQPWKPYMQSLYIDLDMDPSLPPKGIHLGFKSGSKFLVDYLKEIESIGVNHVIFNLKFSSRPVAEVLHHLSNDVLKAFR